MAFPALLTGSLSNAAGLGLIGAGIGPFPGGKQSPRIARIVAKPSDFP
jgi:hypothetical protein